MTEVKGAAAADIEGIAEALVKAFDDDPVMRHIFTHTTTGGPCGGTLSRPSRNQLCRQR